MKKYEQVLDKIEKLDLSIIHLKLQDNIDGEGWSKSKCIKAEEEYKKFLKLVKLFPEESIVPTKKMDAFWHYHILDTRKYITDCNEIFGSYLHHFPYLGLRGNDDKRLLNQCFAKTKALYKEVFGIELIAKRSSVCTGGDGGSVCASGCNPKKISV